MTKRGRNKQNIIWRLDLRQKYAQRDDQPGSTSVRSLGNHPFSNPGYAMSREGKVRNVKYPSRTEAVIGSSNRVKAERTPVFEEESYVY
ncbi:uncharacterized protein EAE98_006137 [Botrytis deweyae]|uniref:Uncharacterized protein n=1 Tax=Botrytis deweyae TaxID=2478750 RepID=A0ABQ7ILS5_9HELO|nr:uncharacterized protein EAE98_006137 [Botrytis deweyae]KAF7927755.1 hypothetical protein EAE98_006137 [Botrytis deweyae]